MGGQLEIGGTTLTTDLGPAIAIDVRDVSEAILAAITADAGCGSDAGVWATDGDRAVAAIAYTPTGAALVLRGRDRSLWRITVEPADTSDPDDITPSLRTLLHDRPAGWYVADGLRLISGPFRSEEDAESERRRVAASRTDLTTATRTTHPCRSGPLPPTSGAAMTRFDQQPSQNWTTRRDGGADMRFLQTLAVVRATAFQR